MRALPFALAAICAACSAPRGLNQPCVLVRGNPDGGAALPLLKSDDAIRLAANKDFLSFGAAECPSRICVRDSAYADDPNDNGLEARGYCSAACGGYCPSENPALDQDPKTRLSCRALLLDPDTLMAIKAADPERYKMLFGEATVSSFCARAGVHADAGP
jgi:hypothetical protein